MKRLGRWHSRKGSWQLSTVWFIPNASLKPGGGHCVRGDDRQKKEIQFLSNQHVVCCWDDPKITFYLSVKDKLK